MKNNECHSLKVFSPSYFSITKENNNFTVGKTGRYDHIQVMKVDITNNKICWHHTPLVGCTKKDTMSLLWSSCQKVHKLSLIMGRHQTDPPWETFYRATKVLKDEDKSSHIQEETKETQHINAMWDPGLVGSWNRKRINSNKVYNLAVSIVAILIAGYLSYWH